MLEPAPLRFVSPPRGWPKSIDLLGQTWKVKYSSNLATDRDALGVTVPMERLIILDTNQATESMVDVLMHECVHAIFSMSPHWTMDEATEEALVRTLAPGLVSLLRSNRPWWHR